MQEDDLPMSARGDWPTLVRLFAEASPLTQSHWNPQTGETFWLGRGRDRRPKAEAFEQRLMREDGWHEVPWLESDEAFALTRAFVEALRPGRGKVELLHALESAKPFRALRAVLGRAPGLDRRYRKAVQAEAELRLAEFCLGLGLRLPDARFDAAVTQLEEVAEPAEVTFETPCASPVRRSIAALSLGRALDED